MNVEHRIHLFFLSFLLFSIGTLLRCGKVDIESLECLKPTRSCPMLSSSIKEVGDGEHQVVGTSW